MFEELTVDQVKKWKYPGGEVGIRALQKIPEDIVWRIQNSDDLINLCMLRSSVTEEAISSYRDTKDNVNFNVGMKRIYIPYMPYARQDRIATKGDPLSINVLAIILKNFATEIHTLDLHSEKAYSWLSDNINTINHSPLPYIKEFLVQAKIEAQITFVSPDEGAKLKVKEYADKLNSNGIVYCGKKRDPITGKLCGFTIDGYTHTKTPNALVITDDICDGGGTFLGLADVLKAEYPGIPIYLFTTHGIYSQGLDKLAAVFEKIGSTNSFIHGLKSDKLIKTEIDFGVEK